MAQRIYWFDDDAAHLDALSEFIAGRYPGRRLAGESLKIGILAYCPKPVNFQYLEHLIATALEPAKPRQRA